MLALTLVQPWAELIVRGPKRVENRTWQPHGLRVGGYLAIHAGKRLDADCWHGAVETAICAGLLASLPVLAKFDQTPPKKRGDRFDPEKAYVQNAVPYSAIVGVARLAGVEREEPADGDPWWFGPVGWRLDDVVAIDPVPCSGAQGLWALDEATYQAVRAAWKAARSGAVRA